MRHWSLGPLNHADRAEDRLGRAARGGGLARGEHAQVDVRAEAGLQLQLERAARPTARRAVPAMQLALRAVDDDRLRGRRCPGPAPRPSGRRRGSGRRGPRRSCRSARRWRPRSDRGSRPARSAGAAKETWKPAKCRSQPAGSPPGIDRRRRQDGGRGRRARSRGRRRRRFGSRARAPGERSHLRRGDDVGGDGLVGRGLPAGQRRQAIAAVADVRHPDRQLRFPQPAVGDDGVGGAAVHRQRPGPARRGAAADRSTSRPARGAAPRSARRGRAAPRRRRR